MPSPLISIDIPTDDNIQTEDSPRTPPQPPKMPPVCPPAPKKQIGEPLLDADPGRYCLFPIRYPEIYEMYLQSVASFWVAQEIDLSGDMRDWEKLTEDERHFLKYVLAFFASADGVVCTNLAARFMVDVQVSEARAFYAMQMAFETIHGEVYSLLLDTYVKHENEKDTMFRAIDTIPCIKKKADWAIQWIESDNTFGERLIAYIAVEGIHFSGSFAAIFYMRKRGLMSGLSQANELIARDEGLHANFGCLLFNMLNDKPTAARVCDIITSAVDIEKEFVSESLPVALIGMNSDSMCQYIEFVADVMMVKLGLDKIYNVQNPFDWMETISLQGKTNFFEKKVSEYSKANVMNSRNVEHAHTFTTDVEF